MVQLLQNSRSTRSRGRKWLLWLGGAVVVAGAAAWLAKEPVARRYQFWKQQRALGQAREFVAARDALSAQLALDVALKAAPGNADTIRVAADILEQVGSAQSMRLRRAVTQLLPESAEDAAKLVICCLRFGDFNAAKDALATASPAVSREIPMMQAALAYALRTGDTPVADALLAELRARLPEDGELRIAQAMLHLRHPAPEKRAEAQRVLEEISRSRPERALEINRRLAGAAIEREDYAEARRRLELVLADAGAAFDDRLNKANIELLIDHRPFEPVLAELAPLALRTPAEAAQLMRWLLVQKRTEEARRWLDGLPAGFRAERPIRGLEADLAAQQGQWDALAPMLEAGVWGSVPAESVRLAMSARLVEAQNNRALRAEIWDAALRAGGGSLSALVVLHRLATLWGWDKEVESTLWAVARGAPDQTWAHQELFNTYRERGNTAGMREVLGALRQADPMVERYRYDWALLTLLRDPTTAWNAAKDTLKALHEQHPDNASYATGHAFALAQSERVAEALEVMNTLSEEARSFPPRLPYLAYVNGMARKPEEVRRLAELGRQSGVRYLAEETRLFELAAEAAVRPLARPKVRRETKTPEAEASPAADS